MKLNLLPTTVSTANRGRNALIGSILLVAISGAATAYMAIASSAYLARETQRESDAVAPATAAVAAAKTGDAATATPEVAALVKNVALAQAMIKHSDVYPKLYDDLRPYIPSFFRLTSLSATPLTGGGGAATTPAPGNLGPDGNPATTTAPGAAAGGGTSTINMQGVIRTYQEYADLMLALLRIPGAQTVARAGFTGVQPEVPVITEIDQNGRPRLPSEAPIPDDPLDRLTYFTDEPKQEGYLNSGGFGSGTEGLRTITPNASLVSVQVTVARDLQTPDPRTTISSITGGGAAGGTAVGGVPSAPGIPGSTPTGSPVGAIPSARGASGRAGAAAAAGADE